MTTTCCVVGAQTLIKQDDLDCQMPQGPNDIAPLSTTGFEGGIPAAGLEQRLGAQKSLRKLLDMISSQHCATTMPFELSELRTSTLKPTPQDHGTLCLFQNLADLQLEGIVLVDDQRANFQPLALQQSTCWLLVGNADNMEAAVYGFD